MRTMTLTAGIVLFSVAMAHASTITNASFETNSDWSFSHHWPGNTYATCKFYADYSSSWSTDGTQALRLYNTGGHTQTNAWSQASQTVTLNRIAGFTFLVTGSSYTYEKISVRLDDVVLGEYRRGWTSGSATYEDLGGNIYKVTVEVPQAMQSGTYDFALRYISAPWTGTGRPGSTYYVDQLETVSGAPTPLAIIAALPLIGAFITRRA